MRAVPDGDFDAAQVDLIAERQLRQNGRANRSSGSSDNASEAGSETARRLADAEAALMAIHNRNLELERQAALDAAERRQMVAEVERLTRELRHSEAERHVEAARAAGAEAEVTLLLDTRTYRWSSPVRTAYGRVRNGPPSVEP